MTPSLRLVLRTLPVGLWLACIAAPLQAQPTDSTAVLMQRLLHHEVIVRLAGGPDPLATPPTPRSTPVERARALEALEALFDEIGLTAMRHTYRYPNANALVDLLLPPHRGINSYAVLEATVPSDSYLIVGAHYDSDPGSPGAGDNAAGVSVVYALARALGHIDTRRKHVLFVLFDQEEDDEVGSRAFARYLKHHRYNVHSVHITDLPGWDRDGDRVIEVQSPGPLLDARYHAAAQALGHTIRVTGGGSSDNKSFLDAGYATAGVFGDVTRHLHQPTDTYRTVDFPYLMALTALMHEVLQHLVRGT